LVDVSYIKSFLFGTIRKWLEAKEVNDSEKQSVSSLFFDSVSSFFFYQILDFGKNRSWILDEILDKQASDLRWLGPGFEMGVRSRILDFLFWFFGEKQSVSSSFFKKGVFYE